MEIKNLVEDIVPKTRIVLLSHESELKSKIHEWLGKKGFLVRFVGKNLIDPIWKLIIGPMLPFIVEKVVLLILGITAPQIVPFIPLIYSLLNYIRNDSNTANIAEFLKLVESFKLDKDISTAIYSSPLVLADAKNSQEYFDGKS